MSDYLINCVYNAFAHGLYSIGVLHIPKKFSKEDNMVSRPRLFYFGKIKRFVWNGVGIMEWGKSLEVEGIAKVCHPTRSR